ncbi:hypothetical protein HID58_021970 [Brassica napus]|uniref:Secreted protein n=1 Tax=Brassica napus TaxID=3708 RepID=A0ABQ8CYT4_BRANA|nr:hypothetical protein HID58_021970 [Brassica napus]
MQLKAACFIRFTLFFSIREEDRMCDFRRNYGSVGATARLEQRWVRVCGRRENDCLTPCHESFSIFLERTCTVASGNDVIMSSDLSTINHKHHRPHQGHTRALFPSLSTTLYSLMEL